MKSRSDLIADGTPYKLDTLGGLKEVKNLIGRKGIEFLRLQHTLMRLETEHKEMLRQRRLEKQAQDRTVKRFICGEE